MMSCKHSQEYTRGTGGRVTFCGVPARRARGNENADKLAKRALKRDSRSRPASLQKEVEKCNKKEHLSNVAERWGHRCQIQKCIKVSRVDGRSRREEVAWTGG